MEGYITLQDSEIFLNIPPYAMETKRIITTTEEVHSWGMSLKMTEDGWGSS